MKIIGLCILDFRILYNFVTLLKNSNFKFEIFNNLENINPNIGVIIANTPINFPNTVYFDGDVEKCLRQAYSYLYSVPRFNDLIIGIDPGEIPGAVIVGDGNILEEFLITNFKAIREKIEKIKKDYNPGHFKIKVGSGDVKNRNKIINQLIDYFEVEIVDEKNTTDFKRDDIKSAKKIAFLNGTKAAKKLKFKYSTGTLREIQSKSRSLGNGNLTISTTLAKKVLEGKIGLEEALKIQEASKKKKK